MTEKKKVVRKPRAKKVTRIAFVIDRSGSMSGIREETFNGINQQIAEIKANAKKTGETYTTYVQFDDIIETVFANVLAKDLKPITQDQYQPRGWTALNDGIGQAIAELQKAEVTENTAYLVVVVSDGKENASKKYNKESISQLTKALTDSGKWTFTYMMANLSTQDQAEFKSAYNVPVANFATFEASCKGATHSNATMSSALRSYSTKRGDGALSVSNFYEPSVTATPDADAVNTPTVTTSSTK